jgi:hypothetical protein
LTKRIREKWAIQSEDDSQELPHIRISIVKDNEHIGIIFLVVYW